MTAPSSPPTAPAPAAASPPPADLALRLRRAGTAELRELLDAHAERLGVREVRQALLNPFATAEVVEGLAAIRRLHAVYEVRAAVARHPRTPGPVALRFVPGLYWRDLLEVTVDLRIAAAVRRVADKYLMRRLPRLAVGERIAIARRASGEVAAALARDREPRVIAALLENPRVVEGDVVALAGDPEATPRVLDLVARDGRFGPRYAVRAALARNARAPLRAIFAILPTLRRPELEAVVATGELASIVRHRAAALLAEREGAFDHPQGDG